METTYGRDRQLYSINERYKIIDREKLLETGSITFIEECGIKYQEIKINLNHHFQFKHTKKKYANTLTVYAGNDGIGNLIPNSKEEADKRLDLALDILKEEYGIELHKNDLVPTESEININIELDKPYSMYSADLLPALLKSAVNNRSKKNKKKKPIEIDGYFAFDNDCIKLKIYNKKQDLLENKKKKGVTDTIYNYISPYKDIIRFEIVYKKSNRKIENATIDELMDEEIKAEIYKEMFLPYLKDLRKRQGLLKKQITYISGNFTKKKKKDLVRHILSYKTHAGNIDVLDVVEILYCFHKNNKYKNDETSIKSLSIVYQELSTEKINDGTNTIGIERYLGVNGLLLELINKLQLQEKDEYIELLEDMENFFRKILKFTENI